MLRECHRVLAPGGRIAGYVIHTPAGLSRAQELRAVDLGPTEVGAPAEPSELTRQAGFRIALTEDVTASFRDACRALLQARTENAAQLRIDEGDRLFEEEMEKKSNMLEGIEAGLLRRSLIVAIRT